jgi:hypothetical protein
MADGRVAVAGILAAPKVIITLQRNMLDFSGKMGGEGAYALLIDAASARRKRFGCILHIGNVHREGLMFSSQMNHFNKKTRK